MGPKSRAQRARLANLVAIAKQDVPVEVEDDDSILISMEPTSTFDLSSPSETTKCRGYDISSCNCVFREKKS